MLIKVKNYEHFNRALGKHIFSKRQYQDEMARGGYIPFEEGEHLANKNRRESYKPYDKPSKEALDLIRNINMKSPDKNGKIKLSDREIDAMKKVGVNFQFKFQPETLKGGFK